MTHLIETKNENYDMGSLNHSIIQARLARWLPDDNFTIAIELSLDASPIDLSQFGLKIKEELKPDICLYPSSVGLRQLGDVTKMSEMPLLAIEIISPTQGTDELLAKIRAYFALGVKSCWLIVPALNSITVFSNDKPEEFKNFDKRDTEVIDEVLDIRVPIQQIFR